MQTDLPDDVSEFGQMLEERGGMPKKRAQVYARYDYGASNSEIAEELGISTGSVANHYDLALQDISEARMLAHLAHQPAYLSGLSNEVGRCVDEMVEHTVAFSLSLPRIVTVDGEEKLSIERAPVLEGKFVESDSILLTFYNGMERGDARYFTIEERNLTKFIHDWIVPDRLSVLRRGLVRSDYADSWILTDVFEPEWLEEKLAEAGIERVELLVDSRFRSPLEEQGVTVHDSALTGQTYEGFKVGYRPTATEVAQCVSEGELALEDAEDMTRLTKEQITSLA